MCLVSALTGAPNWGPLRNGGMAAWAHDGPHDGTRVQLLVALLQQHDCRMNDAVADRVLPRHGLSKAESREIVGVLLRQGRAVIDHAQGELRLIGDDCPE